MLDAGAQRLSAEEFQQQIVQHTVFGPSPTGGTVELVHTAGGVVTGVGTPPYVQQSNPVATQIDGEWKTDDNGRICTTLAIIGVGRRSGMLPPRCQFWFKLGEAYFLSDSDSDRYAKVLSRKIKR